MKRILILLAFVIIVSIVAAACGDDNDDQVSDPISGVGPGISIGEALTSDLAGPLLVNGHLHVQNDQVRLCEVLAESLPPQCGGGILVVEGLGPDDNRRPYE